MKNFIRILLGIFLLSIFSLLLFVGSQDLTNKETVLLTVVLTITSVAATWIASHYYSESTYKQAVEQVNNENQSKLKTYALKAAEKVNNLSKELKRLSVYLQDELDQDFDDQNEENFSKEERIKSAIHIVETLKSINDTSLSDWEGVISEELEEKEEEEREREETLLNIIEKYEDIISNRKTNYSEHFTLNDDGQINNEINTLNDKIDSIMKELNTPRIAKTQKKKRNVKEEVINTCPHCNKEINYKQRPKPNSVKNFKCECGGELTGRWNVEKGFYLEIPRVEIEEIDCPSCANNITIKLYSKLHSKLEGKCDKCENYFRVTRRANDLLIKPIGAIILDESIKLSEEIIEKVKQNLPEQPWPSGTHQQIAANLNLPPKLITKAMDQLIKRGEALVQVNGKLYIEKK